VHRGVVIFVFVRAGIRAGNVEVIILNLYSQIVHLFSRPEKFNCNKSGALKYDLVLTNQASSGPAIWHFGVDPDPDLDPRIHPLTNGSGSGIQDPGSVSCNFFVIDLQDANKKLISYKVFMLITFWRYIYIIYKDKKFKRIKKNRRNQGFCLMIEEGSGSGSIPLTNESGFGSRRPKNMWIRWIQIRIRNTASFNFNFWLIISLSCLWT
jgi:hypothetical protein